MDMKKYSYEIGLKGNKTINGVIINEKSKENICRDFLSNEYSQIMDEKEIIVFKVSEIIYIKLKES